VFGIGFTEMALVGVLFLLFFGPEKLPQMARDAGRFLGKAQSTMDEFKAELTPGTEDAPGPKKGQATRRVKEPVKGDT
jgi:Tat protein translocase TatB subunit